MTDPGRQRGTREAPQRICVAPGRVADPRLPADRACRRGADRTHGGCCGHSAGAAAGGARAVGGRLGRSNARARPARAVVDPDSADRGGRDGGRPARGIRRDHAGAVSKPPRRSRAGRRFLRRRVRGCGSDRLHRQPDRREPALHAESIAAARGFRGLAGDDGRPLFDREPFGPDLDCDLPAGGNCDRRHRQCRHRASGVHRRRSPVARHHVLAAGLAERGDLAQACHAGAGAGARPDRLRLDRARARRAGARRGRGVSQRRRRRAAEADFDRAGVGDDRALRFRSAASSDLSASWCRICCGW